MINSHSLQTMDTSRMACRDVSFDTPCCRFFPHEQPTFSCRLWQTRQRPSARNNSASSSRLLLLPIPTTTGSHMEALTFGSIKGRSKFLERGDYSKRGRKIYRKERGKLFRLTQKRREARKQSCFQGESAESLEGRKSFDFFFLVVEKEMSDGCHPCRHPWLVLFLCVLHFAISIL